MLICNVDYKKNISWGKIDNEIFVFNESTQEIFVLKGFNKDLWLTIEKKKAIKDIYSILNVIYTNNTNNLLFDIIKQINRLFEQGLLEVSSN